jgi:cyclopropane fatty-acyl-phospholipid synthase-like methyltransferase
MKKWIYEVLYGIPFVPIAWIFGSPHETKAYTELFENGHIKPGRAIDLGCGEGSNAIYLSKMGYDVTGVDFSPTALKRARANARAEGVEVTFIEEDLTNLRHVGGNYELLVDFGALNDLKPGDRDLYMENILPLASPGSTFILMCFTKSLPPEEVKNRFGDHFQIKNLFMRSERVTSRTIDFYSMTR